MKISLVNLVFILALSACGTEARQFDISKVLTFGLDFEGDLGTQISNESDLDFKDLSSYQDYTEAYYINDLTYTYHPDIDNLSLDGSVLGYLISEGTEYPLFELDQFDFESEHEGSIFPSQQAVDIATQQLLTSGAIVIRLDCNVDQIPAKFSIDLHFDTTVSVDLDSAL
ncbi:MAG: hypothetical protein ABJN36_13225 [Cyclobacteriaceae bacterium]